MRRFTLLNVCVFAVLMGACAPKGNPELRAIDARRYPDPALGTNNPESEWYKTQILASTSAPSPAAALPNAPSPSRPAPADMSAGTYPGQSAAVSGIQGSARKTPKAVGTKSGGVGQTGPAMSTGNSSQ